MLRFRAISIPRKLVLLILLTTAASLLLACLGFVVHDVIKFRNQMRQDLYARAVLVGSSSTAALTFDEAGPLAEVMSALSRDPHLLAACVYNARGRVLALHVRPNLRKTLEPPPPEAEGTRFGPGHLVVFHEVRSSDGLLGTVVLQSDLGALTSRLQNYAGIAALVLFISLAFALLLSAGLQRLISQPLRELAGTANRVAEGRDYAARAVKHSDDEIGHLVDRFNDMLAQIQARDAALQAAQDRLEQRVAERTAELSRANAALQQQILERAKVEEGLRQSEERFALAFQESPLAVSICTLAEGRLLDVNDSFVTLLGLTREDVVGRTADEIGLWARAGDRAALFKELAERRSVHDRECQFRGRPGSLIHTLSSFARIDLDGVACVLVISNDLTARLALEAQLRHAQKMDAVGQLAAGIAHDYNNLMTVIQGHTAMLLERHADDPTLTECLGQVSTAADRAAGLTRQLLAFSRKQVLQPRLTDVNEVVSNLVKMLGRLIGEHIVLRLRLAPGLPAIRADIGMLEQALTNLAVNARDAMPGGGTLTVGTELVELDARQAELRPGARAGHFLCLRVADTGCGMDDATQARIFEPFFTTKEVGKGTGLGLATVYGIVQQHRGWIEVTSRPQAGSEFRIFLPMSGEAPGQTGEEVAASPVRGGRETILVVEDEPPLRNLVRTILQRHGYRILEAADGPEALKIWNQHDTEINLLLTDLVMPGGLSGRELADRLRSKRPGLKVIFTSGYSVDVAGKDLADQDDFHFLPKPFHPPTLVRTVRSRLSALN